MPTRNVQRGFSLVELMVGVVITLIASVIMFQIFALAERNKRTTTGASDAQTNGALALFILEREIRMAGFGLSVGALKDCDAASTRAYYSSDVSDAANDSNLSYIAQPVRIIDGTTDDPTDRILLVMSGSDVPANLRFGRTNLRDSMPLSTSDLKVESTYGCGPGNLILMVQPCAAGGTAAFSCSLMEVTSVDNDVLSLGHVSPSSGASWNPNEAYQTANGWPAFKMNETCKAYGLCMPAPLNPGFTQIGINERHLTSRRVSNTGAPISGTPETSLAPEIMDMQAQYGLSVTPSGTLTWQEPTGSWAGSAVLAQGQIKQIKAIRVAIVARSGEYEKHQNAEGVCDTTTTAPTYSWGDPTAPPISFNTANWPDDWKCYRYKVFATVIPLINVIWAGV